MDRLLRTYRHVAQKEHWCDRCCMCIQPGDFYEGSVYASDMRGIYTLKMHEFPIANSASVGIFECPSEVVCHAEFAY